MCCITFNWKENDAMQKVEHFRTRKTVSWAVIEVTEACNFNCKWCYASSSYRNTKPRYMEKSNLKRMLGMLAASGVRQVTYSGGEPTLYPHLDFAIREARALGLIVHVNTNGYLLTRALANEWKRLGVTQVQINIDSAVPQKHDAIRGMEKSFEKALAALKNVKEAGMTGVSQTVLTSENEHEIMDIIKIARDVGVERVRLWDMMLSGHAKDKESMIPTRYMDILREVSQFALHTGAKSIEAGEPLFPLGHDTGLRVIDSFCVCLAGLLANFSVEGDAYFCCMHRRPIYNIFRDAAGPIADLHSQKIGAFSKAFPLPEKCGNCGFIERCMGGCIARRGYTDDGRDYWCGI